MNNNIYIVMGECGKYSDHNEWTVKAFKTKEKAENYVNKLKSVVEGLTGYGRADLDKHILLKILKLDPSFDIDYTGTSYYFYEIELEE